MMYGPPIVDPFVLLAAETERSAQAHRKARAEVEYLMTLYGPQEVARAARAGLVDRDKPHACARCGEPNPDRLDRDGCRDPGCPEHGQ